MSRKFDSEGLPKPATRRRDWRRIHHSPLFWFGACLFMAAIVVYVMSEDLSWRPRMRQFSGMH
jgi:hypothetical protein